MNKKLLVLIAGFAISAGFVFAEEMKADAPAAPAVDAENMNAEAVNAENMNAEAVNAEDMNAEAGEDTSGGPSSY